MIGDLFFPYNDPLVRDISVYGIFWTSSFVGHPLGSLIFGFLAGKFSPELALRWAVLGFGLSTCLMGLLPTYKDIGFWAPLALTFTRGVQCIFARGERTISRLYLIQRARTSQALALSTIYEILTLLGLMWASFTSFFLFAFFLPAWRLVFFVMGIGCLCLFGQRRDWPNINISKQNNQSRSSPVFSFMLILEIAAAFALTYVTYAITFQFLNSFVTKVTGISYEWMISTNTMFLLFDMLAIIIIGSILKRLNNVKFLPIIMSVSASILAATSIPLFMGLSVWPTCSYLIFLRGWLVIWGVLYSIPAWLWLRQFAQGQYQYLHLGMGTTLGIITFGYGTSFLCLLLYKYSGLIWSPGIYLMLSCFLALWGQKRLFWRFNNHTVISRDNMIR